MPNALTRRPKTVPTHREHWDLSRGIGTRKPWGGSNLCNLPRSNRMSWLSRVRNSLPFGRKRETPDNLWVKCPRCHDMLFAREYEANLYVCPRCEHHGRIGADARFRQILDPGYELLPEPEVREDPLKFRDTKKYPDRLK